jgi:4'-phosphopantetheinyl transferase
MDNRWLSAAEMRHLDTLRVEKRRADWRLGRWTAKRALFEFWHPPPQTFGEVEIIASGSGAPEVFLHHKPAAVSISLSHRAGTAACAISSSDVALGCDLELVEPRSNAFIEDYFTTQEHSLIFMAPLESLWQTVALLWSGKESAMKVLRTGLRINTRRLIVSIDEKASSELDGDSSWYPMQVCYEAKHILHGWWRVSGKLVKTLLSYPPMPPPICFRTSAFTSGAFVDVDDVFRRKAFKHYGDDSLEVLSKP